MKSIGDCPLGAYHYLSPPDGATILEYICNEILGRGDLVAWDLETSGLNPYIDEILLVSFTTNGSLSYVFSPQEIDISPFLKVLSKNPSALHNAKFDCKFIKLKYGVSCNIEWDTMIVHALSLAGIDREVGGNKLDAMSKRYLGISMDKSIRKVFSSEDWKTDEAIAYSALDSLATYRLIEPTKYLLNTAGLNKLWEEVEKKLIPIIIDMEISGINIDLDEALSLRDKYQELMDKAAIEFDNLTKYVECVDVPCQACLALRKKAKRCKKTVVDVTCDVCNTTGFVKEDVEFHISPSSNQQVIQYFEKIGIKIPQKERPNGTVTPSVDDASLKSIKHPAARLLEEYRDYSKKISAFLIPWTTSIDEDPKGVYNPYTKAIHANFNQMGSDRVESKIASTVATGRFSSDSPNLMQVPKGSEFRHIFVAPEGQVLLSLDYSSIEIRLLAEFSKDKQLAKLFNMRKALVDKLEALLNEIDEVVYTPELGEKYPEIKEAFLKVSKYDFHGQTAITMFGLDPDEIDYESAEWKLKRSLSKSLSFGIPYGSGPSKIMEQINLTSKNKITLEEAIQHYDNYFSTFPGVKRFLDSVKSAIKVPQDEEYGDKIGLYGKKISWSESMYGRRRFYILPDENYPEGEKRKILSSIERQAANMRIQSTSADMTKLAMVWLYQSFNENEKYKDCRIRLTIHDELVVSCPEKIYKEVVRLQKEIMLKASKLFLKTIPSEVGISIGKAWEH